MMTETVVNVQDAPNSNAAKQPPQNGNTTGVQWIGNGKVNLEYFKTLPGLIKLVELVFGIICMSLASAFWESATHFFIFVATVSFIGTLIWVFIFFLGIREGLGNFPINWILTELISNASCTLFYGIAFLVQICVWAGSIFPDKGKNIAAGVFGIFQTILYGFGTYLLWLEHKRN